MTKIVGVRFRQAGKIYYFDPKDLDIKMGDHVIVETIRGIEYGKVLIAPKDVEDDEINSPLKAVIRIATAEDDDIAERNRYREREAFLVCQEKIRKHELEMKLVQAEYTFDNNKLLFYFTADGRVDFRELVKDLAGVFRTRIELRQIGVRDETKILGGIGICGRPLCCHTYLADFAPVSIKMAKEQNLSLNPTKISGVCGRLMCCLKNEEETYEYLNSKLPRVGERVTTFDNIRGEVQSVSVLRQTVKVIVQVGDDREIREYSVDDLKFQGKRRREEIQLTKEEELELRALEDDAPVEEKKERRNNKDRKERRDNRQPKENGQPGESRQSGENRQPKENGQSGENRQPKENGQSSETSESGAPTENGENRDNKERKDKRDHRRRHRDRRNSGDKNNDGANRRPAEKRVQNNSES